MSDLYRSEVERPMIKSGLSGLGNGWFKLVSVVG